MMCQKRLVKSKPSVNLIDGNRPGSNEIVHLSMIRNWRPFIAGNSFVTMFPFEYFLKDQRWDLAGLYVVRRDLDFC